MDEKLFDEKVLKEFKKEHLVKLVLEMQKEKTLLAKMMQDGLEEVKKKSWNWNEATCCICSMVVVSRSR